MKEKSLKNLHHLQTIVLKDYSKHGLGTKLYAFLRMKLCPILKSAQYVPTEGQILDLGCGTGLFANILYLESSKRKVLGIDRSVKRVETAKKVSKDKPMLNFSVGDVNHISIGKFDTITVIDLLHHMPFAEQDELLKKIYSKLGGNGIAIIKDLEKSPYWKYLFHYLQDYISYRGSKLFFRSASEMEKLLVNIGFDVERISLSSGYPHPHVLYKCRKIDRRLLG